MISFVRLTPEDAPVLAEIGGVSLIQSHGHSAPAAVMQAYREANFSPEACRKELADAENIFHAVIYNGTPAGYSKINFAYPNPLVPLQPVTKLERLYLLEDFFDLKLGHLLLQHAIGLSTAHGDKGMWLTVWQKNDRALRFYQKQGFETVAEDRFVLTPAHANPTWVMLLRY